MNVAAVLLWGFIATVVLATLTEIGQALGWTRLDWPFILGTAFTPDRGRARFVGFAVQLGMGWAFAAIYALAFESLQRAGWWLGAAGGAVHGLALLCVGLPLLPGFHPRMASEERGPEPTGALEPPGFFGLNYGRRTPLVVLLAHLAFGAILGVGYRLVR